MIFKTVTDVSCVLVGRKTRSEEANLETRAHTEDNIKISIKGTECENEVSIQWDLVEAVINTQDP